MKLDLILFFVFIGVFFILLFLINIELNFSHIYFGKLLENKIWEFIIVGVCIFIFGKKVIDSFESEEKNNLEIKK